MPTAVHQPVTTLPIVEAPTPPRSVRTTCPYCGVGCVLDVRVRDGQMTSVHADETAAPNFGMMCPKGALLCKSQPPGRRLGYPMVRDRKGGELRRVSWNEAISVVATGIRAALAERGVDGLAWYGSGQLDSEACYLFSKLFKGFLGCNHTDTNSRLCMSSAVAGYLHAFGSDGPPTCYDDLDHADTFFILGANMAANHPVLFNRVRRRRATCDTARVIVVDPRRSKTAEFADVHLSVRPGGDVALLRLIACGLLKRGEADDAFIAGHTDGFDAFRRLLDDMDEPAMLSAAGVTREQVAAVVAAMSDGRRVLSLYCMGANQSTRGTDKNTSIIDLHLLLGQVGRTGCGPFSLTGQPNAMGGRETGYLSHQLPGYRFVENPAHRAEVEGAWGLPRGSICGEPGRPAVAMFDAAAAGEVGLVWITCTNPAVSMPDLGVAQAALRNTPLVVVQDCFADAETAAYADVLLPAATWGEKDGTMTNSERLVTRSRRVVAPPDDARPDWWMPAAVGRALGFDGFDFASSDAVWDEYRLLTVGTPCDVSGMSNDRLASGPLQWPCPDEDHPGTPRRYTDHLFHTDSGRARFSTAVWAAPAEAPDDAFPLVVTTGRVAAHWHTRARTGSVPELVRQAPEPFVEVNPTDAAAAGVADEQWARVVTRRGYTLARVKVTRSVPPGMIFTPFHWGDSFHPATAANYLTHRATDAVSKQPELKHAAAKLMPATAGEHPVAPPVSNRRSDPEIQ